MTSAVEVDRVVLGFCLLNSSNVVDFHHLKFAAQIWMALGFVWLGSVQLI